MKTPYLIPALFLTVACQPKNQKEAMPPNILWISCEDMSPRLGAYGDAIARTPNLDQLAKESVLYTNAFSVSGVCAPSRASIITGLYPTSFGAMHMRTTSRTASLSQVTDSAALAIPVYEAVPEPGVKCFPEYLRELGYYCTNNSKTDYQFHLPVSAWDESSANAHWKNRPDKDTPFFSVFNITVTHESRIWANADLPRVTSAQSIIVPPYYPETEIVRRDLAIMYDNIARMDSIVGDILNELKERDLLENTLIFFFSDHGDGTPRSKRWLYDSGIKVPLLVRFPEATDAGSKNEELVSFVDFAPTILSFLDIPVPEYMEGQAFLGNQKGSPREYIYAAKDRMDPSMDRARAVRDVRYKYIRNYEPEKPFVQFIPYRNQMPLMQELMRLNEENKLDSLESLWFRDSKPVEELYDTRDDPHEMHNLANLPEYQSKLIELRTAHEEWLEKYGDLGNMPETELVKYLWPPNGEQPVTEPVQMKQEDGMVHLNCPTEGASIVYKHSKLEKSWHLYSREIPSDFDSLITTAIRIGYQQSDTTFFKLN